MRLLLDENVEYRLAASLTTVGHDVTAIAHDYPARLKDDEVLQIAVTEHRILITNDRDFGDLIVHHNLPHRGVIYLRLPTSTVQEKLSVLSRLFITHAQQLQDGLFLVVSARNVRVRST